jgi:hypothetical protein
MKSGWRFKISLSDEHTFMPHGEDEENGGHGHSL